MADWSNIDAYNTYLSQSYGVDSLLSTPTNPTIISGKWSPAGYNMIVGIGGNATIDVGTNTYIYSNYRVFKVLSIKSNNLVELDRALYNTNVDFYNIAQTEYPTILTSDTKKVKALFTAQVQITGSPEYVFPATVADPMRYGLYEWATWLINGGSNQAYLDRSQGIIQKQVDVLSWTYDKDMSIYSGPASAQSYLAQYRNPNYEPGIGNTSTTFSF